MDSVFFIHPVYVYQVSFTQLSLNTGLKASKELNLFS